MKYILSLLLITLLTPFQGLADTNSSKQPTKVHPQDKSQVVSPLRFAFPNKKSVIPEPIVSSEPIMSSQENLDSSTPNKL